MKLLIVGASGLVGSHIFAESKRRGHQTLGTYCRHGKSGLNFFDVTQAAVVRNFFDSVSPEAVIYPAANPNVDYCETHKEETRAVNVIGTKNTMEEAKRRNIPFIYFSSDYVFDGCCGPYKETDLINPISEYGAQKAECERFLTDHLKNFLIIRTTGVYGVEEEQKNFVYGLKKRIAARERASIPNDQFGNPTYAPDLGVATLDLVERGARGIYNICGPSFISRYDFAKEIAKVFNLDSSFISPVLTVELNQAARRPLKGGLITKKLFAELGYELSNLKKGLRDMFDKLNL